MDEYHETHDYSTSKRPGLLNSHFDGDEVQQYWEDLEEMIATETDDMFGSWEVTMRGSVDWRDEDGDTYTSQWTGKAEDYAELGYTPTGGRFTATAERKEMGETKDAIEIEATYYAHHDEAGQFETDDWINIDVETTDSTHALDIQDAIEDTEAGNGFMGLG